MFRSRALACMSLIGALFLAACQKSWNESDGVLHTDKRVGIGTAKPDAALAVKGTVLAEEVKVTVTGWPDYVFERDYPLLGFEALEEYVRREGRLPGVPSATEVSAGGIEIGANQKILLEKVEELTLYVLALKRENEALRSRIERIERGSRP